VLITTARDSNLQHINEPAVLSAHTPSWQLLYVTIAIQKCVKRGALYHDGVTRANEQTIELVRVCSVLSKLKLAAQLCFTYYCPWYYSSMWCLRDKINKILEKIVVISTKTKI